MEDAQNKHKTTSLRIQCLKVANEEEDRISLLPDSLVLEILSRLPDTKYAIRTGSLSKRWKYLWTYVPNISFTYHECFTKFNFMLFIDKTLNQCSRQLNLNKFTLDITYYNQYESLVNNWILNVVNRNVQHVTLSLHVLLHHFFFINSCFTNLTLDGCILNPNGAISWKNLHTLSISNARLNGDLIQNILSGSPLLETFKLGYCHGYSILDITSMSVKNLTFDGYGIWDDISSEPTLIIKINAPNILSLTIKAHFWLDKLLLLNVSSLVEANLNYTKREYYERTLEEADEAEEEMLKEFILSLRHVKELQIGIPCLQVLARLEAKGFTSPLRSDHGPKGDD